MRMHHYPDWTALLDALAASLARAGGEGWLVGGCLRDALLGVLVTDVDVAVRCNPLPVAEGLAQRYSLSMGRLGHDTVRLALQRSPDSHLDLTPLAGKDIADDLARRDFTVNALALPLAARTQWLACISDGQTPMPDVIDPLGGCNDLAARRLVAASAGAFRDDPGRIVRAARMVARFGLRADERTLQLASAAVPLLAALSADRLREEMNLLLALPAAADGVALLDIIGALTTLYPNLRDGSVQWALATLQRLDALVAQSSEEAAGYPAIRAWCNYSARRIALRRAILEQGDISDAETPRLWQQARETLAGDDERTRLVAARLLFQRVGRDEAAAVDALVLAACDVDEPLAERAEALVWTYLNNREAMIPPALLTGSELMAALGMSGGPEVGRLLTAVRVAQLHDEVATREDALTLARRLA